MVLIIILEEYPCLYNNDMKVLSMETDTGYSWKRVDTQRGNIEEAGRHKGSIRNREFS